MFQFVAITKKNRYVGTWPEGEGMIEKATQWLLSHFPRAMVVPATDLIDEREPWVRAEENGQ